MGHRRDAYAAVEEGRMSNLGVSPEGANEGLCQATEGRKA